MCEFDWKTREDAEALVRAGEVKADPQRLQKAQECITRDLEGKIRALSNRPALSFNTRRGNKATIKKL